MAAGAQSAPDRQAGWLETPPYYHPFMRLLLRYLQRYRLLIALALVLAAINQIFSLLDPLIFRYVIDRYATR